MIELVKFIQKSGLATLERNYYIKVNRHQKYPNLVCLKYSHRNSPFTELIVRQARGIILDENNNWEIVSYPYDKFFNYGEKHAATIDWNSAKIYDKLDGSLMVLYYYRDRWLVQTSGRADGSSDVKGYELTFKDLFWQVWQQLGYQLPQEFDRCFMFELTTPFNRIIVPQKDSLLVLHGVRNLSNLKEESPEIWAEKYNWKVVKTFEFQDIDFVLEKAKNLSILEGEGFVIKDANFRRIKIKASQYLLLSYRFENILQSDEIESRMLDLILINESDEFLAYFPEFEPIYLQVKSQLDRLIDDIDLCYQKYRDIPLQKDFALAIENHPFKNILFGLRNGKCKTIMQALAKLPQKKIYSHLRSHYEHQGYNKL